jgi:hypothetical protein
MVMERCLYCGKVHMYAANGEHAPRLYTPNPEGFERFLRETVGLNERTPDNTQDVVGVSNEGRSRK